MNIHSRCTVTPSEQSLPEYSQIKVNNQTQWMITKLKRYTHPSCQPNLIAPLVLDQGLRRPPFRYVMLSHTWGADREEVTFRDLVDGADKSKAGYLISYWEGYRVTPQYSIGQYSSKRTSHPSLSQSLAMNGRIKFHTQARSILPPGVFKRPSSGLRCKVTKTVVGERLYIKSPGVSSCGTVCWACKTLPDAAGQALTDLDPLILSHFNSFLSWITEARERQALPLDQSTLSWVPELRAGCRGWNAQL